MVSSPESVQVVRVPEVHENLKLKFCKPFAAIQEMAAGAEDRNATHIQRLGRLLQMECEAQARQKGLGFLKLGFLK